MELLSGKETAERVQGILNAKFQVDGYSVHLTVANIFSLDPTGKVDFSGSDYVAAGKVPMATLRRHPEDRYGWWELGRGSYIVEYNEKLELCTDELALVEAHERLRRAGGSHATMSFRGRVAPVEALLEVGALRLELKQNARISQLRLFRLTPASPAT
jgi:hypothetical protein